MSVPWNYARRGGLRPQVVVAAPEGSVVCYPDGCTVPRSFKQHSAGLWIRAVDAFWSAEGGLDIDLGTNRVGKGFFIKHVYVGGSSSDVVAPEFSVRVFEAPTLVQGMVRVPLQPHMIPAGAVFSLCMCP